MAVLITGGGGFTGAYLTKELLNRGEKVVVFDLFLNESFKKITSENFVFVKGDVSNWPVVLNVVKDNKIDAIFHLAAILSVPSEANPWASVNINALGTFYVLEAARLFQVKKVLFTSSIGSYGVSHDTIVTEETVQRPIIMYGVTKVFGELLGLYYSRKFGIDFRGVRFPQLIGPGVASAGIAQYNPLLIEAAIKGEPFNVWAPEDTVMPMMYIKDAVRSLIMLYDAPEEKLFTRMYNVGQIMPPSTAKELVDVVKRYFPEAKITFKPDPDAINILKTIPRIIKGDKAEKEWGWYFSYSLEDMVRDFIEEFNKMRTP
jgi:threonine 3-dehydrogenase